MVSSQRLQDREPFQRGRRRLSNSPPWQSVKCLIILTASKEKIAVWLHLAPCLLVCLNTLNKLHSQSLFTLHLQKKFAMFCPCFIVPPMAWTWPEWWPYIDTGIILLFPGSGGRWLLTKDCYGALTCGCSAVLTWAPATQEVIWVRGTIAKSS